MATFRLAGIGFRSSDVARLVVGERVTFVADGADLQAMAGNVQIGFVPERSVASVREAIRDTGYQRATITRISANLGLVEGGGILVGLEFSGRAAEVVAECDCCVSGCGTLEFEDERYRGDA